MSRYFNQIQNYKLARALGWKWNFCGLDKRLPVEFGWIHGINYSNALRMGLSNEFINELEKKQDHPYIKGRLINKLTGEQVKSVHSMTSRNRKPMMIEFGVRMNDQKGSQYAHNEGFIEKDENGSLFITENVPREAIPNLIQSAEQRLFGLELDNTRIINDILTSNINLDKSFDENFISTPFLQEMSPVEYHEYLKDSLSSKESNIESYFLNYKGFYSYFEKNNWFNN